MWDSEPGGDFVFGGTDRQHSFDPLSGDVPLFGGEPTDEVGGGAGLGGYLCYDHHLLFERGFILACAQTVGAAHRLEIDIFHCDHRGVRAAYGDDHRADQLGIVLLARRVFAVDYGQLRHSGHVSVHGESELRCVGRFDIRSGFWFGVDVSHNIDGGDS